MRCNCLNQSLTKSAQTVLPMVVVVQPAATINHRYYPHRCYTLSTKLSEPMCDISDGGITYVQY